MKIKGFTLVELMVVMTIMMVLTAIGVVAFSQVSLKSRDGRRQSDLEKIRTALELYRQDTGGTYPGVDNIESALVPKYIQAIPVDPKTKVPYSYNPNGYTYSILTTMESIGSTNLAGAYCTPLAPGCQAEGFLCAIVPGGDACNNVCCNPNTTSAQIALGFTAKYCGALTNSRSCNYQVTNP